MRALQYHAINAIAGGFIGACLHGWQFYVGMAAIVAVMFNVAAGID